MNILKAIVLGIVEGVTEWLPISSTAHIKIFNSFLKLDVTPEFFEVFDVVIQFGAILALLLVMWKQLWPFGKSDKPLGNGILKYVKRNKFFVWLKIAVACIPVIIYQLVFDDIVNFVNENNEMKIIGISLLSVGIVFVIVELAIKKKAPIVNSIKDVTYLNAIVIGLAQLVAAVFPGVSRSGSTIIAALLMGISRFVAIEFTYELSIPVMLGASFMKLIKYEGVFAFSEILIMIVACISAFIVSLFMVRFMLSFIKKHSFIGFGVYRVLAGIMVLLLFI